MTDEKVSQLIHSEFKAKTLSITEQYLKIHEAIYEEGNIQIDRIDREGRSGLIIAYLPVKNEYFYFAVYIDTNTEAIINVGTESRNKVSLHVTSDTLTVAELFSFTKLQATHFWNKGDLKPGGRSVYDHSCIEFTPNQEPDEFEDKLKKLLAFLRTDTDGILALTKNADAFIEGVMDHHWGNQLLGAATIDLESIKILGELDLAIRFDINAWGEHFS